MSSTAFAAWSHVMVMVAVLRNQALSTLPDWSGESMMLNPYSVLEHIIHNGPEIREMHQGSLSVFSHSSI